jgi:hypothetical protein
MQDYVQNTYSTGQVKQVQSKGEKHINAYLESRFVRVSQEKAPSMHLFYPGALPHCLECEYLILKLAHWSSLLKAEAFGCLLKPADHWRRTAKQDLDIIGGFGKPFL